MRGKRRRMRHRCGRANTIYHAENNIVYRIKNAPRIGLLRSLGIVDNACVEKVMTYGLGGPVLLKVESSQIAIGKDIAEKIIVG